MSAAWCYAVVVADAFARDGWFLRSAGLEGGGKVAGLPAFPVDGEDEQVMVGPTEVAIPGREADALSRLGFAPLGMMLRNSYSPRSRSLGTILCPQWLCFIVGVYAN